MVFNVSGSLAYRSTNLAASFLATKLCDAPVSTSALEVLPFTTASTNISDDFLVPKRKYLGYVVLSLWPFDLSLDTAE